MRNAFFFPIGLNRRPRLRRGPKGRLLAHYRRGPWELGSDYNKVILVSARTSPVRIGLCLQRACKLTNTVRSLKARWRRSTRRFLAPENLRRLSASKLVAKTFRKCGKSRSLTVIRPDSIFASLLREQFQPAIFKRVDSDSCDHPLRIRSARMEGPPTFCLCLVHKVSCKETNCSQDLGDVY